MERNPLWVSSDFSKCSHYAFDIIHSSYTLAHIVTHRHRSKKTDTGNRIHGLLSVRRISLFVSSVHLARECCWMPELPEVAATNFCVAHSCPWCWNGTERGALTLPFFPAPLECEGWKLWSSERIAFWMRSKSRRLFFCFFDINSCIYQIYSIQN